jgi:hypothetical protein
MDAPIYMEVYSRVIHESYEDDEYKERKKIVATFHILYYTFQVEFVNTQLWENLKILRTKVQRIF